MFEKIIALSLEITGPDEIKAYAIRKLAEQISACVEYRGEGSRQLTDWLEAEKFFENYNFKTAAEILARARADTTCSNPGVCHLFSEVGLLVQAFRQGRDIDYHLGRWVWNVGYQPIKYCLPRPPYGIILME